LLSVLYVKSGIEIKRAFRAVGTTANGIYSAVSAGGEYVGNCSEAMLEMTATSLPWYGA